MATTALVVAGVGALASTAGSLYSGYQDKKAQEDQLEYLKSQAGMLGPLGMIFGGDNLQAIKDSYNKLLSEEGMSWLGSPEQANIGAFYAHIKPEERAFLDQIMAAARQAPPEETAASDFLGSLLRGEFLPGQARQSPFLDPLIDSIRRNAREAATFAGEQFRSEGSKILGGLSGAGSFLPIYGDQMRDFQTRETDLTNQAYFDTFQDVLAKMVSGLGQAPSVAAMPFARLGVGRSAAALPRELRDVGIQRSLAAFEGRANRFAGAVGQGVGAVAGLPWNPTSFPTPSNAYIGNAVSDLGNSLMLMGMMGAGGGGGAPMSVGAAPNVGVTSAPVTAYQPALTATQPAPSLYSQYAPFGVTPSANTAGAFGGTVRRY